MTRVRIKKNSASAKRPKYGHPGDAGLDLFSCENHRLEPGGRHSFSTGWAFEIPRGYVGLVWDRSGLASKNGIHCLAGVVDSGYRGELKIVLLNTGQEPYHVKNGDKIAQLLIQPVEHMEIKEAESLSDTTRGSAGFGSTGR